MAFNPLGTFVQGSLSGFGTWQPAAATTGTDTAATSGTVYYGGIWVPGNIFASGIQYLIGSVGGTDKVIVSLHDAGGTLLANSATAGVTVGTAANSQQVPFTAPVQLPGGSLVLVGLTFNGTTAKFRSLPAFCNVGTNAIGGSAAQTFGTPASFTPSATVFTADKMPCASFYQA